MPKPAAPVNLTPVTDRVNSLEAAVKAIKIPQPAAPVDLAPLNKRVDAIDQAVKSVIDQGLRTGDIYTGDGQQKVGTKEMGDAIVNAL